MKRYSFILAIAAGLCIISQPVWASKAFVTDNFRISLRRGPSIENKILKFLPSGLPVEVLESEEGWSRVRPLEPDEANLEGWVLSRYLIVRLPWKEQAESLKKDNDRLTEELASTKNKLKDAIQKEQILSSEVKRYTDILGKSQAEFNALKKDASNYLDLKADYEMLKKDTKRLEKENEALRTSQRNQWFATGALILLCGLMIGLLFGKQEKKRKGYY
jgi:SH3 domain protein